MPSEIWSDISGIILGEGVSARRLAGWVEGKAGMIELTAEELERRGLGHEGSHNNHRSPRERMWQTSSLRHRPCQATKKRLWSMRW